MQDKKVVVIGGGIAGLCAAVYARKSGYQVEVLEMHDSPGGLATSWRRGDYTFETCLHWLLGSNPQRPMYRRWHEVFDISRLKFVYPEEYLRLETEHGVTLSIYTDVDRLEQELLRVAPEDAKEIHHLASCVRKLAGFTVPDLDGSWLANCVSFLHTLPYLPLLHEWSAITGREYSARFKHPLLQSLFASGDLSELSMTTFVCMLAWMSAHDAGYPVGGSQALIGGIVENLLTLEGRLRFGSKVKKIIVDQDVATGVQLENGETIDADWVISAADGHATVYDLLDGRYADKETNAIYTNLRTFSSYLQVSLGVARDLSQYPPFVRLLLDKRLQVDPETELGQVSFRVFHYDPTFAPSGKTAVTSFLPTRNFQFWTDLAQHDAAQYQAEKNRIAHAVIALFESKIPDLCGAVEVVDVSTPATIIRFTGNWKGSMEGWLFTPETGFRPLPRTLPGLQNFMMVGQWVMPGGGLPSGLLTARAAIKAMCKEDGAPFLVHGASHPSSVLT